MAHIYHINEESMENEKFRPVLIVMKNKSIQLSRL